MLKARFPDASYEQAILMLLGRDFSSGDTADCASTELEIKLDRLEEILSLLALTNVEIADVYRRQVGHELATLHHVSGHLADLAVACEIEGDPQ